MSGSEKIHVLYVDDESILHDSFKLSLEKSSPFQVDVAQSGTEALEMLQTDSFDAVVADYQMPEMNGIELLKHLRSTGCAIPFVILTGKSQEAIAIEALNEGADLYLLKEGDPGTIYPQLAKRILSLVNKKYADSTTLEKKMALTELVNAYPYVAVLLNAKSQVIALNTKAEDFLGYFSEKNKKRIIGKGPFDLLPRDIAETKQHTIRKAEETGKEVVTYEDYFGKTFHGRTMPYYDTDGNLLYFSYFQRPVSKEEHRKSAVLSPELERIMAGFETYLSDIQFLFVSDLAMQMMLLMEDSGKTIPELVKITGSSTSNITTRIKILRGKGLLEKNDTLYRLSSIGSILISSVNAFISAVDLCNPDRQNQDEDFNARDLYLLNKKEAQSILRSGLTTTILLALHDGDKTRYELREITGSSSVALSPKLGWLRDKKIIQERGQEYQLSRTGKIIASRIEEYILTSVVLNKHLDYWTTHTLDWMPDSARNTFYKLADTELIYDTPDDIYINFENFLDIISEAKYLHSISNYMIPVISEVVAEKVYQGIEIQAVIAPEVAKKLLEPPYSDTTQYLDQYHNIDLLVAEFPRLFSCSVTDKSFTFKLMSKDCKFFDTSQGLVSKSPEARIWGERLFQHYKQQSIPIQQFLPTKYDRLTRKNRNHFSA